MYLSQANTPLGNIRGVGNLGDPGVGAAPYGVFSRFISNLIGLLTIGAGIWFMLQIILSGYRMLTAGGDKQQVQDAQKRLQNGLVGIFIVIISYALGGIVGIFLGIDLLNPVNILYSLIP